MTVYGAFGDGKEVNAQLLRLAMMVLLNTNGSSLTCDGGVRMNAIALDALQVVAGSSGLTVKVKPGMCVVPGTETTGQGPYFVANDADLTVTLATADGSQSRYDRIVAAVDDNGDGTTSYTITKVTGTPSGTPALPAIPANSLKLGAVLVPALAATPGVLTITDERRALGALGRTNQLIPFTIGDLDTPEFTTTSSTFRTMQSANIVSTQYQKLFVRVLCRASDGSTSGEVRVTVNDVQFGPTQTLSAGFYNYVDWASDVMPGFPATNNFGTGITIRVQARRTAGSGTIGVRVTSASMNPLS